MNFILTIFKKELIDTLRDRRTIIAMVLVPVMMIPLMLMVMTRIQSSQAKKAREEVLTVGLVTHGNAADFKNMLERKDRVTVIEDIPTDSAGIATLITEDSLDAAFIFVEDFDQRVAELRAGRLKFYFKSTEDDDITKDRLQDFVERFEKKLVSARFRELNIDKRIIKPLTMVETNIATKKERVGRAIGAFLPYMFVIFCFMGSMYPAIDLGAGEKERGTIETLLTAPVSRFQILLGKFGVVMLTGIVSAGMSMFGMYLGFKQMHEIPPEAVEAVLNILEVKSILMVLSLLLPLTAFFAGVLLSLSIFAKSFKEAQSIISPMTIIVILPVLVGLLPGMELNAKTALIPILNISLATKEVLAGTIHTGLLIEVYVSLFILAGLSLFGCSKMFERESAIFRS
ncbi:MAG: ABC transporter permease subunit [bacterium]